MPDDELKPPGSSGADRGEQDPKKKKKGEEKKEEEAGQKGTQDQKWKKGSEYEHEKGKTWGKDGWEKKEEQKKKPTHKWTLIERTWVKKEDYLGDLDKKAEGKNKFAEGKAGIGLFHYDLKAKSEISLDLDKKEANFTPVDAEAGFAIVHGEAEGKFKLAKWIKSLFSDDDPKPAPPATPGVMGIPMLMAARVGDMTSHGSPLAPGIGSSNVIIGNMPAWRTELDFHACPIVKGVVPDVGGVIMMGSPTVFINYMMACRVMDMVVEVPGGPNPIAMGCPTVFIGGGGAAGGGAAGGGAATVREAAGKTTSDAEKEDDNPLTVQGKAEGELGSVKAELHAGAEANATKIKGELKAGVMAAAAKGSVQAGVTIPVPWTSHSVTLGASVQGYAGAAGIEGHYGGGWERGKGVEFKGGVNAAWGLGCGVNFNIGFK